MKVIKTRQLLIVSLSICLWLWGCATQTTTTTGKDFDSAQVSQIVKGKSTSGEIVTMFGIPETKQPDANEGEKWIYFYGASTVKSSGMTPGGAFAAVLIPGAVGNTVAAANYSPNVAVHNKTLILHLDKRNIVLDFALEE